MSLAGDQLQFSPERDCKPFKVIGAASNWFCCQWDLQTWINKLTGTLFTFRLHQINPADDSVPWENESAATYELSLEQFIEWRSGNAPSTSDNPLKNVPQNEFWAYSGYNHLAKVKSPPSELINCLKWSDLGFGNKLGDGLDSTLWIGTKKASTPCHFDTYAYNLVVQIKGKKKWTLFPPQDTPNLYPTRIPYEESSVFSEVNFEGINPVKFPLVSRTTPYIVTLEPGDVLYVPPHWWHWVQCVDDDDSTMCVSVNQWIPIASDKVDSIGEALVSLLTSHLFPAHQPPEENWLNDPNYPMLSPQTSLQLIQQLFKKMSESDQTDGSTSRSITQTPSSAECIEPVSQQNLLWRPWDWSVPSTSSTTRTSVIPEKEIINAILKPNVISEILKNLSR